MTEPFRPDDELVSAVLDGEATPEERARVAADPVLSARLAEFQAVHDAVAQPVAAPDAGARERAIAAAKVAVRHHGEDDVVRPLRRRGPARDVQRFLAVAAAVLLVVAGLGVLARSVGGDDSGNDSAADMAATGEDGDDSAGSGGAESAADEDTAGAAVDALRGADLGSVDDDAQLERELNAYGLPRSAGDVETTSSFEPSTVAGEVLPQAAVADGTRGASEACQVGLVEVDPQLSGLLAQATVTFDGKPAVVYLYATPEGRERVVVVGSEDCRTLTVFDL
jgi:hypothetical protein